MSDYLDNICCVIVIPMTLYYPPKFTNSMYTCISGKNYENKLKNTLFCFLIIELKGASYNSVSDHSVECFWFVCFVCVCAFVWLFFFGGGQDGMGHNFIRF